MSYRLLVVAAVLVGMPTVVRAQYGFDQVPDTVFHSGEWVQYGSDRVASGTTLHGETPNSYGFDRVPPGTHPHVVHRQHRRLLETVQQLTAAMEQEIPRTATQPQPSQPKPLPARRGSAGSMRSTNCTGQR